MMSAWKSALAAVLLGGALVAAPVEACQLMVNHYEWEALHNLQAKIEAAETIDWINVSATASPRCKAVPPAVPPRDQGFCRSRNFDEMAFFEGQVMERLKGTSSDRFPLVSWTGGYTGLDGPRAPYVVEPRIQPFSDVREHLEANEVLFRAVQRQEAAAGHRSLAYWDASDARFDSAFNAINCGRPEPAIDPTMTYVVLRDANGYATALIPVTLNDDELLVRLREARDSPGVEIRKSYRVEDFFRNAHALALVRTASCPFFQVTAAVERGDKEAFAGRLFSMEGICEDPELVSPLYLQETLDLHGLPTQPGIPALVVQYKLPGDFQPIDRNWIEAEYPGWLSSPDGLHWADYIDGTMEGSWPGNEIVILIDDSGFVRLTDIPTDLQLIGPETLSVDRIFAWFEEGRAASNPAPASS